MFISACPVRCLRVVVSAVGCFSEWGCKTARFINGLTFRYITSSECFFLSTSRSFPSLRLTASIRAESHFRLYYSAVKYLLTLQALFRGEIFHLPYYPSALMLRDHYLRPIELFGNRIRWTTRKRFCRPFCIFSTFLMCWLLPVVSYWSHPELVASKVLALRSLL